MHYYYGIIGPQNHNGDGLLGSNSIIVVYMDPLGYPYFIVRILQQGEPTKGTTIKRVAYL